MYALQVVQYIKALVGGEAAVLRAQEAHCLAETRGPEGTRSSVLCISVNVR